MRNRSGANRNLPESDTHSLGVYPSGEATVAATYGKIERRGADCHRGHRQLPRFLPNVRGISLRRFQLDAPDFRMLSQMVEAGRHNLATIKRFDMPGFRSRPEYVREMKRDGVLPTDLPADAPSDVYATDRDYWESLWYWQTSALPAAVQSVPPSGS